MPYAPMSIMLDCNSVLTAINKKLSLLNQQQIICKKKKKKKKNEKKEKKKNTEH